MTGDERSQGDARWSEARPSEALFKIAATIHEPHHCRCCLVAVVCAALRCVSPGT